MILDNYNEKNCSFQISVFSLEKNLLAVKPIVDNDPFLPIDDLKKLKDIISNISKEFEKALDFDDMKQYKKTIEEIKKNEFGIEFKSINKYIKMNLPKKYIEEMFEKNDWITLEIYYNTMVVNTIFFLKEKEIQNRALIKRFLALAKKLVCELNTNIKLKLYQKIQILINIFTLIKYIKDEKEVDNLNLKYFLFSEAKENSILRKVKNFFENLIPNITEESIIFHNLLSLNSGRGFYKNKPIYCFDMQNEKMVQDHLKEIFPEILIFYSANNDNLAFHRSQGGGIAINEYKAVIEQFDVSNLDYLEPCDSEKADDIAMNLVLILFHEYLGHKKYHSNFLGDYNEIGSPKKYVNELNEVFELKPSKNKKENNKYCDYILGQESNKKGDSGHYFELAYGKIRGKLVLKYLIEFNDNGKLLNFPNLFYAESSETLKKYVELKAICKKRKISLNFDKSMTIEEEIDDMDKKRKKFNNKRLRDNNKDDENEVMSSKNIYQKESKNPEIKNESDFQSLTSEISLSEDSEEEIKSRNNKDSFEDSDDEDQSLTSIEKIEKKVAKKFNFPLGDTLIDRINKKYYDADVSPDDRIDFQHILANYSVQE